MLVPRSIRTQRPPHWLPLPGAKRGRASVQQVIDENDSFTKGDVVKLFPQQGFGFLRRPQGDDVYFSRAELHLVGEKDWAELLEGMRVGFDVAWTSKGLHITKLKIY